MTKSKFSFIVIALGLASCGGDDPAEGSKTSGATAVTPSSGISAEPWDGPDHEDDFGRFMIHRVTDESIKAWSKEKESGGGWLTIGNGCSQEEFNKCNQPEGVLELEIDHGNVRISDFSPVAGLSKLKRFNANSLEASQNNPIDLSPLADLGDLEEVDFYATRVANTDALAGKEKLRRVSLYMSAVDSIDFLTTTPGVLELSLYGFEHTFKDYSPLLKLPVLRNLDIYMNKQATDELLAPLAELTTLEEISMSNCDQVTSFGFLKGCKDIKVINANWCTKLADISDLAELKQLQRVEIADLPIDDLSAFTGNSNLDELDISGTKITDLAGLSGCTNLKSLDVSETEVADISILGECAGLQKLVLKATAVSDLSPLSACSGLSWLDIRGSKVSDLTPLLELKSMRSLVVDEKFPTAQVDAIKEAIPTLEVRIEN